jgi:hypothetical protein
MKLYHGSNMSVPNPALLDSLRGLDLVIGPVANDTVFNVIDLYIDGILDKDETIKRLKIRKLFDQWTFCTEKAISFLKFINNETIV